MLQKGKLARRVLVPLAAGAALVGVFGVGPAFASNDWTSGFISSAHSRSADSHISGARAFLTIGWNGTDVDIDGFVDDTARDGRSAVMEIRYQVFYSGTWHTHIRYPGKASGKGDRDNVGPDRSLHPMRSVVARACTSNNGNIVSCDSWR